MNHGKEMTKQRRTISRVLLAGYIIFINCFCFPVYNLNKEWPLTITILYLLLSPCCAFCVGGFLAKCFPEKHFGFIIVITVVLTYMGLGCRFLLEFGEVSNTYNFTLPNILLHTLVFVVLCLLAWFQFVKQTKS